MTPSPEGDPRSSTLREYHRVLVGISWALIGGVAAMAGGAWFLVATGTFHPFLGFSTPVRIGIAVFLVLLLLAAGPLQRAVGGGEPPEDEAAALARVQTRVMVGMAVRDAVGAMAAVLILLSGDVLVGGSVAAATLVAMVSDLPAMDDLEAAVRGLDDL